MAWALSKLEAGHAPHEPLNRRRLPALGQSLCVDRYLPNPQPCGNQVCWAHALCKRDHARAAEMMLNPHYLIFLV